MGEALLVYPVFSNGWRGIAFERNFFPVFANFGAEVAVIFVIQCGLWLWVCGLEGGCDWNGGGWVGRCCSWDC